MKPGRYRYPLSIQLAKVVSWVIVVIILLFLVFALLSNPLALITNLAGAFSLIFPMTFGIILSLYVGSSYPNIDVDEQGILVEFLWHHLRVPWNEIIEVRSVRVAFRSVWLVRTRKLSPLHRLYGLLYTGSPQPSFLIHSTISNCADLLREIDHNIEMHSS